MASRIYHFDGDEPLSIHGILDPDDRLVLTINQGDEHVSIAFSEASQADTVASAIPHLIDDLRRAEPIASIRTTNITIATTNSNV
jgi:hypothetical protein